MHINLVLQTFEQLIHQINQQQIHPIYLLAGEEPFFIDQLTAAITTAVSTPESEAFDKTVLYGKDTQPDQLIEAAKRFPMLSPYQLLIVREAQHLERQMDALTPYIQQPQPTTVLVLCYKYKKFDKRTKFFKAVEKNGVYFESKPLYDNQIEPWIQATAQTMGLQMDPAAARLIFFNTGTDLGRIYSELEKLKIIGNTETITTAHIEKHIGFSKDYNNFELVNALADKNFAKAVHIVEQMSNNSKQNPVVVTISTVFSFFQRLLIFHGLTNKSEAAKVLGIRPFFVKQYAQAASRYSMKQCSQAIAVLAQTDRKSKGLGADAAKTEALLQEMLFGLFSS